jgi:tetratricopeptide (TPR) repeat protein
VLLAQGRHHEAAAAFDLYLEKGGEPSAAVYRQRGLAQAKLGRHAQAIDDFGRALAAQPKDEDRAPLHLARGQEYLAINALQPALRDFEVTLRLDPKRADAYLGRAYVRVKQGDLKGALADADRIVKDEPKNPYLWYGAARVYAQAAGLKTEPGPDPRQARLHSRYQDQAVVLLRAALDRVPAGQQQAYWQENVRKDAALSPLQDFPAFVQLNARFGCPEKRVVSPPR